jgi:hypothetical protein
MKYTLILGACALLSLATSQALTEADLTEAAITGKTLTFTIETGAAPFATSGVWTATFGMAPSRELSIQGVTGDTQNSKGRWSYNSAFSGLHEYTLQSFLPGQPDAYLTLWASEGGEGRYEIFLSGLFGTSQTGSLTVGAGSAKHPDLSIQQPIRNELTDAAAASKRNLGKVRVGQASKPMVFTLTNRGDARLTGIRVKKGGAAASDFVASQPAKTSLAVGESTQCRVTFGPTARGIRTAVMRVTSNDPDENPFEIKLVGEGMK